MKRIFILVTVSLLVSCNYDPRPSDIRWVEQDLSQYIWQYTGVCREFMRPNRNIAGFPLTKYVECQQVFSKYYPKELGRVEK